VGIGEGVSGDLTPHVLGRFAAAEKARLEEAISLAAAACECWVADGIQKAMNRFNRKASESAS
jgi:peptidyl-tRNA hydrolase, PTH1 family